MNPPSDGSSPMFSIVTPVFNPPAHAFRSCIDSVLAQSLDDWEWCLADDGSTDQHVEALLREAEHDPRVKVVRRSVNGGIVAASNSAAEIATGHVHVPVRPRRSACATRSGSRLPRRPSRAGRRLHLLRRGQGRRRREPLRSVLQTRLVAGAVARPELLLPPVDHPTLALRRGRWLSHRIRRFTGLRPGAASHRAGSVDRPHSRCAVSLAGGQGRPHPISMRNRRRSTPLSRRFGTTSNAPDQRKSNRVRLLPRSACVDPEPLVSIIMPTHGSSKTVWGKTICLATNAVRSIVDRSTYRNIEVVLVHDTRPPSASSRNGRPAG